MGKWTAVCCPVVAVIQDAKDEPGLEKVVANSGDLVWLVVMSLTFILGG